MHNIFYQIAQNSDNHIYISTKKSPKNGYRKILSHHTHLLHLSDELDVDPLENLADAGDVGALALDD
jgi:hypothetical protein